MKRVMKKVHPHRHRLWRLDKGKGKQCRVLNKV